MIISGDYMKVIKKLILILAIIISLFSVFMVNGIIESIYVNKQINEFKARGEYVFEDYDTIYYQVKPKYDYEDASRPVMTSFFDHRVGSTGDIFVTSRNPLPGNPFMGWISNCTWVGHTGLVIDYYGNETVEVTGNLSPDKNVVRTWENNWITADRGTDQIALLRIKNTTEEQREQMVNYALEKEGLPYNYTFLFNRAHSFYCSDLVSRAVASSGINVNYDYLATTGSDMIVSRNTYIVYYREKISEDMFAVYFLKAEE